MYLFWRGFFFNRIEFLLQEKKMIKFYIYIQTFAGFKNVQIHCHGYEEVGLFSWDVLSHTHTHTHTHNHPVKVVVST